jgi:hypothetical protein
VSAKKAKKQKISVASGLYKGASLDDSEDDEKDYLDVRTKDLLVLHLPELKVSSLCPLPS